MTDDITRMKNAITMVRSLIMSADNKSEIDLYASALEAVIRGAAIDAQYIIKVKHMKDNDDGTDEPAPEAKEVEESKEDPEIEPEEKKRRGRPPKNPMKQAQSLPEMNF